MNTEQTVSSLSPQDYQAARDLLKSGKKARRPMKQLEELLTEATHKDKWLD